VYQATQVACCRGTLINHLEGQEETKSKYVLTFYVGGGIRMCVTTGSLAWQKVNIVPVKEDNPFSA
jgi:hypothetical protein